MIASVARPILLAGLALLTLGEPSQAADWVIDRCQVTYKGTPVPLGMGLPEFTRLFGAPSDSFITPWPGNPGHAPVKTYYWDNMGMRTRFRSDAHTDLFGGVDLAFREPIRHPRMSKRRYPRGTTSIEFRPFGIVDANSIQKVLKEGFKPGHAPDAPESEFLDLDLGQAHGLALLQLKDDRGNFYGLSLRYSVPDGSKHSNYATAQGKMKANCRLP